MDTLSWIDSPSGSLSLNEAWHLQRTRATALPWTALIWNNLVHPRLACFAWRLLLRKTPTDHIAKIRGFHLASRCHIYHQSDESDHHLFISCSWQMSSGPGFFITVVAT